MQEIRSWIRQYRMRFTSTQGLQRTFVNRYTVFTVCLLSALCIIDVIINAQSTLWQSMLGTLIEILLFALSLFHPAIGCVLIIALGQVEVYTPYPTSGFMFLATMLSFVILGYLSNMASAVAFMTVVIFIASRLLTAPIDQWQIMLNSSILYALMCIALILIGMIMRYHHHASEFRRASRNQNRTNAVVAVIHDELCNNLTYSLRLLQTSQGERLTAQQYDALTLALQSSLRQARRALTIIESEADHHPEDDRPLNETQFRTLSKSINDHDDKLHRLGLTGVTMCNIEEIMDHHIQSFDLITHMFDELYGNIAKHSPSKGHYAASISIQGGTWHIDATNTLDPHAEPSGAGHGMTRYRDIIRQFGGSITYGAHEGTWNVDITLPPQPASPLAAKKDPKP